MKLLIFFLLSILSSRAHAQFGAETFAALKKLEGTWEMKTQRGFLLEQWTMVNDSLMKAVSYRIQGTDTSLQETVLLSYSNGRITFTPTVPNQNEGKAVHFTLVSADAPNFVFENKAHDFPQQIIYTPREKILNVIIRGPMGNNIREVPFRFNRKADGQ